jgi:CheY-like chemotaxis protein
MASRIRQSGMHEPAPAVRRRPRVLLIDDDNDVNRFLTSRLEKCGLDVKYACDAQQGFRMACRDEPAVIVTDYFMPNGDAQYLLTKLRTTAATANIPIIVLSGRQLNEVTVQSLRREICGHPGATNPEKIPGRRRIVRGSEKILRLRTGTSGAKSGHGKTALVWGGMRLGWSNKSAANRGSLYFAWGCFRYFSPGPTVHRRRDAMPGPGHVIVSGSRLRDETIQLQHIML